MPKNSHAAPTLPAEDIRTGMSVESIRRAFLDNLFFVQGRFLQVASSDDEYKAHAAPVKYNTRKIETVNKRTPASGIAYVK